MVTWMKRRCIILLVALLLLCLGGALRFYNLSLRPLQWDEGVNYHLLRQMRDEGKYNYNPSKFHGPLFFNLLRFTNDNIAKPNLYRKECGEGKETAACFLDTEISLRALSVIAGIVSIAAIFFLIPFEDKGSVLYALLLLATSPTLVFHSRYAIHEPLCLAFSILSVGCLLRSLFIGKWCYLFFSGVFAGLALAVKESALIFIGTIAVAALDLIRSQRLPIRLKRSLNVILTFMIGVMIAVVLTVSLVELFQGFVDWSFRAAEDRAQYQPWWYFAAILLKGDLVALFGVIIAAWTLILIRPTEPRKDISIFRFFAIWGLLSAVIYSTIPYKTPWLVINFTLPLTVSLGIIAGHCRDKPIFKFVVWLIPFISLYQSIEATFFSHIDKKNAFMYSETDPSIRHLGEVVEHYCSQNAGCVVLVEIPRYWPLPFYLRRYYDRIGYKQIENGEDALAYGDIVIGECSEIPWARRGFKIEDYRISDAQTTRVAIRAED